MVIFLFEEHHGLTGERLQERTVSFLSKDFDEKLEETVWMWEGSGKLFFVQSGPVIIDLVLQILKDDRINLDDVVVVSHYLYPRMSGGGRLRERFMPLTSQPSNKLFQRFVEFIQSPSEETFKEIVGEVKN